MKSQSERLKWSFWERTYRANIFTLVGLRKPFIVDSKNDLCQNMFYAQIIIIIRVVAETREEEGN